MILIQENDSIKSSRVSKFALLINQYIYQNFEFIFKELEN